MRVVRNEYEPFRFTGLWYGFGMMSAEQRRQQEVVTFWRESARRDRDTAQSLFKLKHYDWSLFVFHLAIEKLLKALVVAAGTTPPPTHNLSRLAELATLTLTDEQRDWLEAITDFNIEARYPREKKALYDKATPEFTHLWHHHCATLFIWLEHLLET